jgi:uncharacterized protein (DUF305 family)
MTWRSAIPVMLIPVAILVGRPRPGRSRGPGTTADSSWAALLAGMHTMHAAMGAVEPSGNADVDFVRLMMPHHQGAVDMAKAELLSGTDPQLARLAQEIITDQESELQLMQLWLRQHGATP